jgi:flagellin
MSSVNTNMGAVVSAANMAKFGRELDTSIERLSSGLRINSAKDDAAGMAIVSKMEAQVRGVTQAIRNATDSQKLIDTSEGAHVETLNILQRMRELAVQSANDTNQAIDRTFLNSEVTQLIAEIDRIANQTTWNGEKILDGNFTSKQFQLGANEGEKVTYSIDNAKSSAIGNYKVTGTAFSIADTSATSTITTDTLTISGYIGSSTVSVSAAATAEEVVALVNAKTASTGVKASAETNAKLGSLQATGDLSFTLSNGDSTAAITATITDTSDLRALRDAINAKAGTTGITAEMSASSNADVILTHSNGADIIVQAYGNTDTTGDLTLTSLDTALAAGAGTAVTLDASSDAADDGVVVGVVDLDSHKTFTLTNLATGSATAGFFSTTGTSTSSLDAISAISIGTASGAQSAITVIDGAINKINQSRSNLGAISNRLDSTISNLTNVATNVEGSMSNIKDADFSVETSKLTRAQILTQAATSMLAQANASKQSILALLQG